MMDRYRRNGCGRCTVGQRAVTLRAASAMSGLRWRGMLCLGCMLLMGCGSRSPVVPVTGTVTFADRETPEVCRLDFLPLDAAEGVKLRPNGATLQADGTYKMTPHLGVEGLLPGRYAVRVSFYDLKRGGNPDREGDWREYTYDAGEVTVDPDAGSVVHDITVSAK